MRRPLIFPLIGLTTGIVFGDYFELSSHFILISLISILLLLFIAHKFSYWKISFLLICLIAVLVGIFSIQKQLYITIRKDQNITQYIDSGKKTVEGVIVENHSSYPDKNVLIVRCLRIINNGSYIPAKGMVRLTVPSDLNFFYGDFIRFHSRLKNISSFKNPGGFDYERYLNRQGIYAAGFIANKAGIVLLRKNSASSLKLKVESFRIYLKEIIYNNAPSPQREIIAAMTIGDQNAIPPDIRDNFNKTGTSHILSISGLHVGMVAATAFFLITIILKSSEYLMLRFNIIKVAAAAAFAVVVIYALIAGMGVTVARSALMASVFLIALILGKQRDLYNTLALAGLIILVISPDALFDISFQLSFLAVLSIIYAVPRFSNLSFSSFARLPFLVRTMIRYLYMSILVCVAATIGTLPLIIFYFNRVSSVTIIANLIAVPLLGTLALALAMAFVLSAFVSAPIAGYFIKLSSLFVEVSVVVINKLASFSWSSLSFTKPIIPEIIIFYIFIFLLVQLLDTRYMTENKKSFFLRHSLLLKYALLFVLIFFTSDIIYLSVKDSFSRNLRITTIDVGQGSSILIQFPGGKNMLIDGGGSTDSSFDIGKLVVAPLLYYKRISKIDIVVLTHPHPDHLQGLLYIIDNFNVGEIWSNNLSTDDDLFLEWKKNINQKKIKNTYLLAQSPAMNINNTEMEILWPLKPINTLLASSAYTDVNDSSLVLKLKYNNIKFLITGDISSAVEYSLINSGKDLQSSVLFVPHHGSADSSNDKFLKRVSCRYAVISAGRGNPFHHPHPLVLMRYKEAYVQVLRTDHHGAISFITDGTRLYLETFVQHR
jgi:competence protein ComEC